MSRWFRMYDDVLDDPKVQRLPPDLFKDAFLRACKGEATEFGDLVRPDHGRLHSRAWRKITEKVFARDRFTCRYCGEREGDLECDHVVPLSRGGSNDEDNLVTACRPCNRTKSDRTPEEMGWV